MYKIWNLCNFAQVSYFVHFSWVQQHNRMITCILRSLFFWICCQLINIQSMWGFTVSDFPFVCMCAHLFLLFRATGSKFCVKVVSRIYIMKSLQWISFILVIGQKFHSWPCNYEWNLERTSNSSQSTCQEVCFWKNYSRKSYYILLPYVLYCIHFWRTSACVCRSQNCKSLVLQDKCVIEIFCPLLVTMVGTGLRSYSRPFPHCIVSLKPRLRNFHRKDNFFAFMAMLLYISTLFTMMVFVPK